MQDESLVRVQEDWWSWRSAEVRMCDIDDLHWAQPKGAPRPMLYGYVPCDAIAPGSIPHDCAPDRGHRVRVCVLKKHVVMSSYVELVRRSYAAIPVRSPAKVGAAVRR